MWWNWNPEWFKGASGYQHIWFPGHYWTDGVQIHSTCEKKKNIYKEILPFTIPMWHVFNGAIIQCHSHLRGELYIDLKLDCLEPEPLAVGYSRGLAVSLLELPLSCIWRLTMERYPQSNRATEMAVALYAFPSSNSDSKQLIFIKFPNCCRGKTDSSRLISPLM